MLCPVPSSLNHSERLVYKTRAHTKQLDGAGITVCKMTSNVAPLPSGNEDVRIHVYGGQARYRGIGHLRRHRIVPSGGRSIVRKLTFL